MVKKEILQNLDWDDLPPSLYWIIMCSPLSAPLGLEAGLMPDPGQGEVL